MKVGHRLNSWIFCVAIIAAIPAFGSTNVAAAPLAAPTAQPAASAHVSPFLPLSAKERNTARSRTLKRGGSVSATSLAIGRGSASRSQPGTKPSASHASTVAAPPVASTTPDTLAAFPGTSQTDAIGKLGGDQEVTPPNEDVAVSPSAVVEVVNSSIYVFSRDETGPIADADLNVFMNVAPNFHSSDPRVIYDASAGRFWVTVTEVPDSYASPSNCPAAQPILIAVSPSSNPLPFTGWIVYGLPMAKSPNEVPVPTEFGDQPGLGIGSYVVTVTWDDYTCNNVFQGSEIDVLQKVDFEHATGNSSLYFFYDGPFAPQPVQGLGPMSLTYIVSNYSDCLGNGCLNNTTPVALVQAFTGEPEAPGGVANQPFHYVPMTPTAVNDTTGFLPPADQPSPGPQLQTNDDRFLNAVWENGKIWTADGTSCIPSGDSVQRDCLDYVEIAASGTSIATNPTLANQQNNIGINGADLFYPAVSVDAAGDMITVFDESSTALLPSDLDASIAQGGTTLSSFHTLHTSTTYYNGDDLFPGACDPVEGCRWGDYSGAAQDPLNPKDVWVVSGSADDGIPAGPCVTIHACWDTQVAEVTVAGPLITSLNPAYGAVAGGQNVTVDGTDFGLDTTATFNGSPITLTNFTPNSFTFVTPPSAASGGTAQVQATDVLGASPEGAQSLFTYLGLSNYTPVSPFRILDTRPKSCIQCTTDPTFGPGVTRRLQVTGVGAHPIPGNATAAVLNVTEVAGTGGGLLTVYPYGSVNRPTASNLNFPPGKVISNLVTVTVGTGGAVDIYNALGSTNVIVDVEGYFTVHPSSDFPGLFHPMTPVRLCDTRHTTVCEGHGIVGSGTSIVVTLASAGGVPSDGTAGAVVVNLTGVAGNASTYLSVFPTNASGECVPTGTSTINLLPGAVAANRAMVELGPTTSGGPDDAICVYNAVGSINVLVDVNGWYGGATATATPTGYQYQALAPTRICDTRFESASCYAPLAIGAGTANQRLLVVAGADGVPSGGTVVAIVANLTGIVPTTRTFLTLYPANLPGPPGVSDLNLEAGAVLANLSLVAVDTNGEADLYNGAGSVNAIIDLEGWFQ